MGLAERLLRRFVRPRPISSLEERGEACQQEVKTIYFYDLRNEQKASERGVSPGYYLGVIPITEQESEDDGILTNLQEVLLQTMLKVVPLPRGDTKIFIDAKGTYIDPSHGWLFSEIDYFPDMQMLVVKADRLDPEEAQKEIVGSFSRRKN